MIGPFINSAGIILGGIVGVLLARHVPKRLQEELWCRYPIYGAIL